MTKEEISLEHEVAIDLVCDFLNLLNSTLNELEGDPENGQHVMVAGLSERLQTNAQGCVELARAGLSAEVKILARACIEATFKLQAICMNPNLMQVYAQEHLFFQRRALRAVTTDLKSSFSPEELVGAAAQLDVVNAEVASLGAREMQIWEWSREANLAEMYRSLYALYSGFVHASSSSLTDWLPMDAEGNLVEIVSGPTDFDLSGTLLSVATCLHYCLHDINVLMGLDIGDALNELRARRDDAYGFAKVGS